MMDILGQDDQHKYQDMVSLASKDVEWGGNKGRVIKSVNIMLLNIDMQKTMHLCCSF